MTSPERLTGILLLVAMPIGNAGDIGARALELLARADVIACEDTRRTGAMLATHQIRRPLISYFEHNEQRRISQIIERLQRGETVALVSDAGTPAISDPGFKLVRTAIEAGIPVTAVPGPSAAIAALTISGLPTDRFAFEGFLPERAAARRNALEQIARERRTLVFFEAARRLAETLAGMADAFGADRRAAVVRELTKTHEETVRASLGELANRFRDERALGEVTIVVEGAPEGYANRAPEITVEDLTAEGVSLSSASAIVARLSGRSRREVYQEALRRKTNSTPNKGEDH